MCSSDLRTSNSFQGPFLAKRIEFSLRSGAVTHLLADFRWLLLSATLATVAGALLVPTFQRIFSRAVLHFQAHRSIPRLLLHGRQGWTVLHLRRGHGALRRPPEATEAQA